MRRVRVGAVGAGWWATTNHFPLLARRPDVELVGVCSKGPDTSRIRDQFGFAHATESLDQLLDMDLDAVVIATPHHLHHEQAIAALDRGLHVMCEKPMTLLAADAWDLADRTARAGTHFLVPLGWNYKPFVIETKRLVDRGLLGDIQHVTCQMASPTKDFFGGSVDHVPAQWASSTRPDPRTWQSPEQGGGYAHGQMSHATGLLFWLTELRAASVAGRTSRMGAAVDLYDAAVVRFDNGSVGSFSGAATLPDDDPFQVDIRVFGSEGVLLLDVERARAVVRRHDGRHTEVEVHPGDGAYECIAPVQRFVDLVVGAESENNSPPAAVARSVELIEALLRSSERDGAEVEVRRDLGPAWNTAADSDIPPAKADLRESS